MPFLRSDIPVYDLVNRLPNTSWQSIMEMDAFGQSTLPLLLSLSVQYCRFQWSIKILDTVDATHLRKLVSCILSLLEDVRKVAAKYARTKNPSSRTAFFSSKASSEIPSLRTHWAMILPIKPYASNLNTVSAHQTSLTSRTWKASDEESLKDKIDKISEYNDKLEKLLPVAVRESLYQQGLPRIMLMEENKDNINSIAEALHDICPSMKGYADLRLTLPPADFIQEYDPQVPLRAKPVPGVASSRTQLIDWETDQGSTTRALFEELPIHSWTLATTSEKEHARLSKLVRIHSYHNKPTDLRILDVIHSSLNRYCLTLTLKLPSFANQTTQPVSLHSMLNQNPFDPNTTSTGPPMSRRILLASQLSNTLHALSLTRFLHGDLNSHNIAFFRDSTDPKNILLDRPYLTGFRTTLTMKRFPSQSNSTYHHPTLHSLATVPQGGYTSHHEVYSFGLLLFEILTWTALDTTLTPDLTLTPSQQQERVQTHCNETMAALLQAPEHIVSHNGVRTDFAPLVQACLSWADDQKKLQIYPDTFYWDVVVFLARQLDTENPIKGREREVVDAIWQLTSRAR